MGRARGSSLAAQSSNAAAVQCERLYRQQLNECTAILQLHAQARGPCLSYLKDLGFSMDVEPAMHVAESNQTAARKVAAQKRKELKQAELAERHAHPDPDDCIPSVYNRVGKLRSKALMENVMPALAPVALSSANCSAMLAKLKLTKADAQQDCLLQHLEFFTGEVRSFPLLQVHSRWSGFLNRLKQMCNERGRLHSNTQIPINFDTDGLYQVDGCDAELEEVYIRHRLTKQCIAIPGAAFGTPPPSDLSKCSLVCPWSETMAELQCVDASKTVMLKAYFPIQTLPKHRAIEDGSGSSSSSRRAKRKRGMD